MPRVLFVLLALALLAPPSAEAQSLRDRLRRAASDATSGDAPSPAAPERAAPPTPPSRSSMEIDSEAALADQETCAPLAFDGPVPPTVMMESVLRHLRMVPTTGDLRLEVVSVAFPPARDATGAEVDYGEQMRFHVRLRDAAGSLLMDRYYHPRGNTNRVFTRFEWATSAPINRRDIARMDTNNPLVLTTAGAYRLEFLLDDELFWQLPFEVARIASTDPYAQAGPRYVIRGAWQAYGYLGFGDLYSRAERSTKLYWYAHTQLESADEQRVAVPLSVQLVQGGRVLAEGHTDEVYLTLDRRLEAWPMRPPGGGDDITRDDLADGAYEIRYAIGDDTREYPFEIRGGAIVSQGLQVREGTDPTRVIEGINESWWLQAR